MDGTDADGEWSDEEILQSGSQTGLSETELEDGKLDNIVHIVRPRPLHSYSVSSGAPINMSKSADPVSVMLNKIDAELKSVDKKDNTFEGRSRFSDLPSNGHGNHHNVQGSKDSVLSTSDVTSYKILNDAVSLSPSVSQESRENREVKAESDAPRDLDPITALEIDARFKDIMSKKKDEIQLSESTRRHQKISEIFPTEKSVLKETVVSPSNYGQGRQLESLLSRLRSKTCSRPSAMMLSTGYATDNESVKTEDFESKFLSLMVQPSDTERTHLNPKTIDELPPCDTNHKSMPGILELNEPRITGPYIGLQRYRTTDNSRGVTDSKLNVNRKGNQVFSWDDEFWKQTARRGTQSVASSFEEVESLCLSKSSSDSMGSTQRYWDRMNHGTNVGQDPVLMGPKRRFMSRQSSTTSTSTSRSSGLMAEPVTPEVQSDPSHHNASIKDTLLESMELLGTHGNLDLAEKIYLEKIFQRVLDWNNGMPVTSTNSSKALDKHFWSSLQNQANSHIREENRDTNSPQMSTALKEKWERLNKRDQSPVTSKMILQLPAADKKRRRDLIVPDEEEVTTSLKQSKSNSKPASSTKSNASVYSRETSKSSRELRGDGSSRKSRLSSMSSLSMDNGSLRGSPQGSVAPPTQSVSLATFLQPAFRLSGSFESTASPPDTFMFNQPYTPSHAERVLMGLGFGATEGFLPERFLRDWYTKIAKAQMEAQITAQAEVKTPEISENFQTFANSTYPPTSPGDAEQEIIKSTSSDRRDSHASTTSSVLDEAANFFPSNMGPDSKIQRLKEYIAAYSNPSNSPTDGRDYRMMHFATSRQKSLPLFLETLSEEEEGRSRITGVDPYDKETRLQMFISDAMSSSGKSTGSNSEKSYISSNQSESDSMSSSSEKRSSHQRRNQNNDAYKKHLAEELKLDTERRAKENKLRKLTDNNESEVRNTADGLKPRHKGSPSRQATVKKAEHFNAAPVSKQTSSNSVLLLEHPTNSTDMDLRASQDNLTTEFSNSKAPTSNLKQDSVHSKDSIEVEDIMLHLSPKGSSWGKYSTDSNVHQSRGGQVVEPAMVSIVLEDVDRDASTSDNLLSVSYLGLPASRCSSSSLSPIPQSPVTVIEVGLDNQQDSLDTEGTASSKETDEDSCHQQGLSYEDFGIRKLPRSKSRSSKTYSSPNHEEAPRRRFSTVSPVSLSRLSPSKEFGAAKPRRRLSLEVPVTPEVRYMLERQRAYSIGQLNEDPELCRAREAGKRAPVSDESKSAEVNTSEEKRLKFSESRSSSPKRRSDSKQSIIDEPSSDERSITKVDNDDMVKDCKSLQNNAALPTPLKSDVLVNRSNESSPGSSHSAFRIAIKSNKEKRTSDENLHNSSMQVSYPQAFIENITRSTRSQLIDSTRVSDIDRPKEAIVLSATQSQDSFSPPLNFCDARPHVKDLRSYPGLGSRVHCISRAVQVNENVPNSRMFPLQQNASDLGYYYACDKSTQCPHEEALTRDHFYKVQGINSFNKFTQTGVPMFEVSCQTNNSPSDPASNNASHDSCSTFFNIMSKKYENISVNTVMSMIGVEHDHDIVMNFKPTIDSQQSSSIREPVADFNLVDETLEQIEMELNLLKKKEYRNYFNFISKVDNGYQVLNTNVDNQHARRIQKEDVKVMRTKSLDSSVRSRITPANWTEAISSQNQVTSVPLTDSYRASKSSRSQSVVSYHEPNEPFVVGSNPLKHESNVISEQFLESESKPWTIMKVQDNTTSCLAPSSHEGIVDNETGISEICPRFRHTCSMESNIIDDETGIKINSKMGVCDSKCNIGDNTHVTKAENNMNIVTLNIINKTLDIETGDNNDDTYCDSLNNNDEKGKADLTSGIVDTRRSISVNNSQEKVTQWRRFSLPTLGYQRNSVIRSHSKLSRLKYQTNSQNSCRSFDLEMDFMNASDPIAKLLAEDYELSSPTLQQSHRRMIAAQSAYNTIKTTSPTLSTSDAKEYTLLEKEEECHWKKPASPKISALRESHLSGKCSEAESGNSTPEIMISPLRAFQMDFLQIPGSPKDYVSKAFYPSPSSSSGSLSPYSLVDVSKTQLEPDADTHVLDFRDNQAVQLEAVECISNPSSKGGIKHFQNTEPMKTSMSDSDFPVSTIGSTVDLSLVSSVEQSIDELSDTSMLPRLSVDSALEECKRGKKTAELTIDVDQVIIADGLKMNSPDFHTTLLNLQKESISTAPSSAKMICFQDSFDLEDASNKSVAGSDVFLDDLDTELSPDVHSKTRYSSASSYSDPMLDNIDSLSQDSLFSEDGMFFMNLLSVGDRMDELLQVSDYGGLSPSPTQMRTSADDTPERVTNYTSGDAISDRPLKKVIQKQRKKKSSKATDDNSTDSEEESKKRNSQVERKNQEIEQTTNDTNSNSTKYRSKATNFNQIRPENSKKIMNRKCSKNGDVAEDDSSGDECDKEILRINLNRPPRRRLVKMNSDPVDKDIFCKTTIPLLPLSQSKDAVIQDDKCENKKADESLKENTSISEVISSSDMMTLFQNAEISTLQSLLSKPLARELENQDTFLADQSKIGLHSSTEIANCSNACILGIEFTSQDSMDNLDSKDCQIDTLDDDIDMMDLFENIETYDMYRYFPQDESISTRLYPLPQISEEETVSEDNTSEASGIKHNSGPPNENASTESECDNNAEITSEKELDKPNANAVIDIHLNAPDSKTIPVFDCKHSGTDDDVFQQFGNPIVTPMINSVYTRCLISEDRIDVNRRVVSPSSKIFDFAQSIMNDAIKLASPDSTEDINDIPTCNDLATFHDATILTESDDNDKVMVPVAARESSVNFSSDYTIAGSFPNRSKTQTHIVEKKVDVYGNLVTKFASSHTIKFNNFNSLPTTTQPESKKHVSTVSLIIGDYKHKNNCVKIGEDTNLESNAVKVPLLRELGENSPVSVDDTSYSTNDSLQRSNKKEELRKKVRSLLLLDAPSNEKVLENPKNSVKITELDENVVTANNIPEVGLLGMDEEIDLKSRVKAMLLIDDKPALHESRVKVTTMYSRNGMEARSSFSSYSFSDVDDPACTDECESLKIRGQHKNIQTQPAPGMSIDSSTVEIGKKPRKLRTRDSLLKLHEQTNISSSIGSEPDSELVSALRNQGDYDVKERDLALGLLSDDFIDEEDTPVTFVNIFKRESEKGGIVCATFDKRSNNLDIESSSLNCNTEVTELDANSRQNEEIQAAGKEFQTPKVVIQQPSEDSSLENLKRFNLPLLNLAPSTGNLDNGLDITSPPTDSPDSKYRFFTKHGASTTWLRRSPRMHFLSPNAALSHKKYYDYLPAKDYSTPGIDDSHPELAYLDILPKFSQEPFGGSRNTLASTPKQEVSQIPSFIFQEPQDALEPANPSYFRFSMRSPEPKPTVFDSYEFGNVIVADAISECPESSNNWNLHFSDVGDTFSTETRNTGDDSADLCEDVISSVLNGELGFDAFSENHELEKTISYNYDIFRHFNSDTSNHNSTTSALSYKPDNCCQNQDDLLNEISQKWIFGSEHSTNSMINESMIDFDRNEKIFITDSSAQLNGSDDLFLEDNSDIGQHLSSHATSEACHIEEEVHANRELITVSEGAWSNAPDNVPDQESPQYKKLLSVTSHDSGFDSQGSPIEFAVAKPPEWASNPVLAVQEEPSSDECDNTMSTSSSSFGYKVA